MNNINSSTPAAGTTVRIIYEAKDGKVTERLVLITHADQKHWHGLDIIKMQPRCFRREGIGLAELIENDDQRQEIYNRLQRIA